MEYDPDQLDSALKAAQMYYYQNLPMKRIAAELQVSHSTISRLLAWARNEGLIEIRINDVRRRSSPLEELIKLQYQLKAVKVVPVAEVAGEDIWQDRVARITANYLNQFMEPDIVLGVAVSEMINQVSAYLSPKSLLSGHIVQLNGGEYVPGSDRQHAGNVITRFANNYDSMAHLFPIPAFFDHPETKPVLWKESSIKRVLGFQNRSEVILFSPEALQAIPIKITTDEIDNLAGCVSNIFIRPDGSFSDIALNQQACGPDLTLFQNAERVICAVSGLDILKVLRGALNGKLLTDLIIDEPTARRLVNSFSVH
ncbi:MAG: sugar-binding transcriptional regulator [Anaerolineae bacterium]